MCAATALWQRKYLVQMVRRQLARFVIIHAKWKLKNMQLSAKKKSQEVMKAAAGKKGGGSSSSSSSSSRKKKK